MFGSDLYEVEGLWFSDLDTQLNSWALDAGTFSATNREQSRPRPNTKPVYGARPIIYLRIGGVNDLVTTGQVRLRCVGWLYCSSNSDIDFSFLPGNCSEFASSKVVG